MALLATRGQFCIANKDVNNNGNRNKERKSSSSSGKKGSTKTKRKNNITVKVKSVNNVPTPKAGNKEMDVALADLAEFIMKPRKARSVPRPMQSSVVPSLYHGKLSITARNNTDRFQGVVFVRQDIGNFLEVHSPGASTTYLDCELFTDHAPGSQDMVSLTAGITYTVPMTYVYQGTDILKANRVQWIDDSVAAWDEENNRFDTGFAWILTDSVAGTPHVYDVNVSTSTSVVNNNGGKLVLIDVQYDTESQTYSTFNSAEITLVSGTDLYSDASGFTLSSLFGFKPIVDMNRIITFNIRTDASMDVTSSTDRQVILPIQYGRVDPFFVLLNSVALQSSISAFDCLASFSGNAFNCSGEIGSARVDPGYQMPVDGKAGISAIASLPENSEVNVMSKGAHNFWMGRRLQDYFLLERGQKTNAPYLYFAWDAPATGGDGQPTSILLQTWANVEWVHPAQTLYRCKCPLGDDVWKDAIGVLSTIQSASENPNHMAKIRDGIKKVVNNPKVRDSARFALSAAKVIAPLLLGMV